MCLSEEGSWSRCKQSGVLQDGWADVQHLRLREVKPVDVEHSAWFDVLLAVADHFYVPGLSAADPLLAELVVLLHLLRLQSKRAARSACCTSAGGTASEDQLLFVLIAWLARLRLPTLGLRGQACVASAAHRVRHSCMNDFIPAMLGLLLKSRSIETAFSERRLRHTRR